ncbi:MAG: RNA polymerase sigma factor [Akkermansiaceae bacterium]
MTPSIAPSIFALPTLLREGWEIDEQIKMIPDKTETRVVPMVDSGMHLSVEATAELLARVSKHDVNALSDLYEAHAGLLMSVIMAVLNNKAESEDILQDSFLAIWNKAGMYSPHLGKPTSWMVTLAKNKAYDRYRKLMRQSEGMVVLKDNYIVKQETAVLAPQAENEELLAGFQDLNPDQQEAIELVFYQGLTQQEAAEKLEAPLGTVKARIRRGLLKLKQCLSKD